MTKEETSWAEEVKHIVRHSSGSGVQYGDSKYPNRLTEEVLINFISKLISQEREKWIRKIEEQKELYTPVYEPIDLGYTRALEWTIDLLKK